MVTTKDTYGHWDDCQMECGAEEVLRYALEQVMTCWNEEVKAGWCVFKLASKQHEVLLSKFQIIATWVFKEVLICNDQLFSSRDSVLKASHLSPGMAMAASIVWGDVVIPLTVIM